MRPSLANRWIRVAAAFGLAMLALGHRFPSLAPDDGTPVEAAYLLPGGVAADLCISGESGAGSSSKGCDACRISGSADLPAAAGVAIAAGPNEKDCRGAGDGISPRRHVYFPAAPPTAPPVRRA
jgi:hypothetical protein